MTIKTKNNDNFTLSMKLDINYDLGYIDILVILFNRGNMKKDMRLFHGNEFDKALQQYKLWEQFIF